MRTTNSNITTMRVNGVVDLLTPLFLKSIKENVVSNLPSLMLWGPPGIGKSDAFKEIAKKLREYTGKTVNVVDVRLLLFNPVDLRGIPVADTTREFAKWLKPSIFNMDPSEDTINLLVLDEISAAPQSVQAAAYQLTLDRKVGEHKLPDNCIIAAAGNRVTDKSVAYKMPKALCNRLTHIELECNVEDWKEWAIPKGICPEIISYISYKESALFDFDPNNDFTAYPTPRTWEMTDKYIKLFGDIKSAFPLISGSIGLGHATEFQQFTKVFSKLPSIEKIMDGSYFDKNGKFDETSMPTEPDVLYALSASISTKVEKINKKQLSNILKYLSQMSPEYATITVKDMLKFKAVKSNILEVEEWVEWSKKFSAYIL